MLRTWLIRSILSKFNSRDDALDFFPEKSFPPQCIFQFSRVFFISSMTSRWEFMLKARNRSLRVCQSNLFQPLLFGQVQYTLVLVQGEAFYMKRSTDRGPNSFRKSKLATIDIRLFLFTVVCVILLMSFMSNRNASMRARIIGLFSFKCRARPPIAFFCSCNWGWHQKGPSQTMLVARTDILETNFIRQNDFKAHKFGTRLTWTLCVKPTELCNNGLSFWSHFPKS